MTASAFAGGSSLTSRVSGSSDDDEDDDDEDDEEVETEGPDLSITYFDYLAYDTEIYYYVDITNTGDEDAGSFYVDVFVDEDDEPELYDDGDDYTTIESLAVGETEYADFLIVRALNRV